MSDDEIRDHARKLRDAIAEMAIRYGASTQDYAYSADAHADERRLRLRACSRQLKALMRLTRALADLAGGDR